MKFGTPAMGAFGALLLCLALSSNAHADCPSAANAIQRENCLLGTPRSEWDVSGAGDPSIQGFATDISVNVGETVNFKINTDATAYTIDIYRMGYYGGMGARLVASIQPSATLPQVQPACVSDSVTKLVDCGNWGTSASWQVPGTAVSGIYFAHLIRTDTGGDSHIVFVVRNDASNSSILFQTSDETWQAYNGYGGSSLYGPENVFDIANRAHKVSYNRPFDTRGFGIEAATWVFGAEYPMIRFLEANGYDVSYFTGIDAARFGSAILKHKLYMTVGHDEYWSGPHRANVEAARDAGVNMAFFSGNEVFWKTRLEPSVDGSNTPNRTLVCYKETIDRTKVDPPDPSVWTGTWRDARFSPPADGGRPENSLTGTLFTVNGPGDDNNGTLSIKVPAADGKMRFWRNTSIANLTSGQTAVLPTQTLGYEWDEDIDNGARPAGTFDLSTATYPLKNDLLLDQGANYGAGIATHHMTLHRALSGALVFGAGTVQWSWGLDNAHDDPFGDPQPPDPRMQQATVNLLADMGVQPGSLQTGLVAAQGSDDTVAPTSTITSPANGATVPSGNSITLSGTAKDAAGGVVGGVELSVDGGTTWHPANGRENWTYSWTPRSGVGSFTLKSRSTDDSGNTETPGSGVSVVTGSADCPCSGFTSSSIPAQIDSGDSNSVELGVRFRADFAGYITGIRFYKAGANTGTHLGSLWSNSIPHTLLARATFTNETASGWQEVSFDQPVAIDANTTYVASYFAPSGHYSATSAAFANTSIDMPPIHFLPNGLDGSNGVYFYGGSSTFPTDSFNATDYWVDVVYIPAGPMPGASPALLANPSKLSFVASGGGSNPPAPQNVSIYNEGDGVLQWTASASAQWLVVSPGSGSTPSSLSISVDPSTLAPGTYTGTVTITAPGATNPPQTIPVSLTVTGVLLVANPSKLSFFASAGGSNPPAPQSISISNEGGGALQWTASSSAPWLVVSPGSGSSLSVSVDTSTLALGTYTGQVTITAPGAANSPQTIPVSLTVANVLLFSNFADGTMQGWAFSPLGLSTNWSVANGALQYNGGGHTQIYAGDAGWKDYTVTAAIKLSTLHDYPGGIRGRIDPDPLSGAGYTAWMYPDEGVIKLFQNSAWNIDSGSGPNLLGQAAVVFDTTNFHNLGLSFQGNQIQVLYDGAVVITFNANDSMSPPNPPRAGLVALDVSSQNVSFTNVTVTSATPTSDSLSVGSTSLDFSATPGTDPAPQTVKLASTGSALVWTATSSASWLSVSPAYGATPADSTAADLQVSVDSSTLASGSYSGTIKVVSLGAVNTTQSIPVTLTVGTSLISQTITITSAVPPAQTYNTAFSVSANGGGSGNPVTFALDASSTACSIGSVVNVGGTFTAPITMTSGTGNCVVDLNQSGNANYSTAAQVQVSIAAAKGTATALTITGPTALTYGTTATATVSGGVGTGAITFSAGASSGCSVNGTTVAVTDATGSCSLTATQEGDNNNGQSTSAPFTVALNKANAVLTVVPYTVSYDGQAHTATGSATGVESTPANLTSLLTLSGTTHTNVGAYKGDIWSFAGNNNYNATSGTVDDNIAQGTSGVTLAFEPAPYVYRGTAFTATAQVTGTSISVPVSYSGDCINVTTANGCTATATYAGDANHAGSTGTSSITVTKANAKITVTGYSVTYDGQPHTATGTALGVESTPANLSSLLTLSGTTHTNVGSYKGDAWSFAGNNNYNAASGTVDDSIGQATSGVTVAFGAGPYVYRGTAFTATAQLTGTNTSVPISYSGDCINVTSANGCTATATYAGDANHAGSTGTNSITITKANAKITVTSYDVTYDGQPHTATGAALGVESTPANLTSLLTLSGTTHTNVDAYKGDVWSFAGNNNYNATSGTVDDNIAQATSGVTLTFEPGPYVYRGTAFTATAQVTGTSLSVPVSYSGDCINVTTANGCTATANYAGDANHAGSTGTSSITVAKANAKMTVTGYSVTYDGQPHTAIGTALGVESAPANLTSMLSLNNTTHTNAGSYKGDTWSFAGNNNYTAATGTVDDTIIQLVPIITWANPGDITYGTALGATQLNATSSVTGSFLYSPAAGAVLSAGAGQTLSVTFTPNDTTNYGATSNTVMLNVVPAAVTVTASDATKAYGQAMTLDNTAFTATGLSNGATITSVSLSSAGATASAALGSYAIVPSAAVGTGLGNYTIVYNNGTLVVTFASAAQDVVAGGTASTDPANAGTSVAVPVQTSVTSPVAGRVSIAETATTEKPPDNYTFFNQQINISFTQTQEQATIGTPTAANPLVLVFNLDKSLIVAGQNEKTTQVFRDGVVIPNCDSTVGTAASPDPCVYARLLLPNGNVQLTVRSSHASRWNFGRFILNTAPVAANDSYPTDAGATLTVAAATGVLANDTDADSNTLTPILLTQPAHGTLTLSSNGGFSYAPAAGYAGADNFTYKDNDGSADSNTATVSINVRATTSTTTTSSLNASTYGQPVTFAASVKSSAGTPTGSVQFLDGATSLGTVSLTGGSASLTATTLDAGPHSVTAVYSGDSNFVGSTSAALSQTVNKATATSTLTAPTAAQYSDVRTFTATFSPSNLAGSPADSVAFKVGSQTVATAPVKLVNGSYQATWTGQLLEPTPFGTAPIGQMKPGLHVVSAIVNASSNFTVTNPANSSINIAKEDARLSMATKSFSLGGSSTGTVPLTVTIRDITAVPGDSAWDGNPGDIRNATVQFMDRATGLALGTAKVTLTGTDSTIGTATYSLSVDLGTATSKTYTIGFLVGNYYTRNTTVDDVTITVTK